LMQLRRGASSVAPRGDVVNRSGHPR
jgi:hypothetical protein